MTNAQWYNLWYQMNRRCHNPSAPNYVDYGARGIHVYNEWRTDFVAFVRYVSNKLGDRPSSDHQLDRKDNDGHYEPGNLRWATRSEQALNRRNRPSKTGHKFISYNAIRDTYRVNIRNSNGRSVRRGSYKSLEKAVEAMNQFLKELGRS